MVVDQEWYKKVVKHLYNRRTRVGKAKDQTNRIFATEKEQAKMEKANKPSIELMKEFLTNLDSLEYTRALDVAGGDGRVAKELLCDLFPAVDFFDQCQVAVDMVRQVKPLIPKLKHVDQETMEQYEFKEQYTLIMMSWCSGFIEDDDLIAFLLKA